MREILADGGRPTRIRGAAGSGAPRPSRPAIVACSFFLVVSVAACGRGGDEAADQERRDARVTQAELGDEWPVTVPYGDFGCAADRSLTFTAPDGTTYAVDYSETTLHLPSFGAIWLDDPTQPGGKKLRVAFMDRGRAYCR